MRSRFLSALSLVTILVLTVITGGTAVAAQNLPESSVSTPVADPVSPQFQIVPVGDYPQGFFDDVAIIPGQSAELTVKVENTGEIPVKLRLFKVNAINGVNGGFVADDESLSPAEATRWIDFPEQRVELEPGASQKVTFSVSVPEGASPGQYISALVARTEPMETPGLENIDHTLGYAISVGILVPGDLHPSFELGPPNVERRGENAVLQVPVTNTGNYLVRPSGLIELVDADGTAIMSSPVEMLSVYGGLTTNMEVVLPGQMPAGNYILNLSLTDEASGASASIEDVAVEVPKAVDPTGVSITKASIEPNAADIAFANVDVTLSNGGQEIPASNVNLDVLHDGELVESFPLATNQVLLSGENALTARYIPADMWESGSYTFRIVISAVDPNGGQETILLTEDLDATITVP